jgi:SAM-dependent methyltransferase
VSRSDTSESVARADCPLCGPERFRPWTREGPWTVVCCRGCGTRLTWPRPDAAALEALYARESYFAERDMGAGAAEGALARAKSLIGGIPGPVQRILDFGAGEGHLVAAFKSLGLQAEGVEPSPAGREAARRLHGLALAPEIGAENGYDLVTALHSLEHVPDPLAALRHLREALRPGGFLLAEVPHAGTVEMWRPARRRLILDLPAHLYHFTPETLSAVLRGAGFEVLAVRLTNPDALEWALALRERLKARARLGPTASGQTEVPGGRSGNEARTLSTDVWLDHVLPWLRRRLPGWKFQVLAQRADGGLGLPSA